jgi:branched-chain amino acid transport system ATP-binding protein
MALLDIAGLDFAYGETQVLWNLNLAVSAGQMVALVGANGAGKTTLIRLISGLVSPLAGRMHFLDADLAGVGPEARVRRGIAQVPEGRRLFAALSVAENLMLGAYSRTDAERVAHDFQTVLGYFPELEVLLRQEAGTLSGGQQQMTAIGRAIMASPKLLMVDEMSLGLAPMVVERLAEVLLDLNRKNHLAILLVEQDVELALELASYGYVMESGRVVMHGPAEELIESADLKSAYMGIA